LGDWYRDVVLKIKQKQSLKQVQELRTIEKKLEGLMSEDKRTNLELEKLSELLGD
jgi:regulator of replication initiation timing